MVDSNKKLDEKSVEAAKALIQRTNSPENLFRLIKENDLVLDLLKDDEIWCTNFLTNLLGNLEISELGFDFEREGEYFNVNLFLSPANGWLCQVGRKQDANTDDTIVSFSTKKGTALFWEMFHGYYTPGTELKKKTTAAEG